jgi:hypothetical protein
MVDGIFPHSFLIVGNTIQPVNKKQLGSYSLRTCLLDLFQYSYIHLECNWINNSEDEDLEMKYLLLLHKADNWNLINKEESQGCFR